MIQTAPAQPWRNARRIEDQKITTTKKSLSDGLNPSSISSGPVPIRLKPPRASVGMARPNSNPPAYVKSKRNHQILSSAHVKGTFVGVAQKLTIALILVFKKVNKKAKTKKKKEDQNKKGGLERERERERGSVRVKE
jgi:hypothetical protein